MNIFHPTDLLKQKNFFFQIKYDFQTNCIAIIRTVLRENFRSHVSNKSSSDGPSNSTTNALYFPHGPK